MQGASRTTPHDESRGVRGSWGARVNLRRESSALKLEVPGRFTVGGIGSAVRIVRDAGAAALVPVRIISSIVVSMVRAISSVVGGTPVRVSVNFPGGGAPCRHRN